MLFRISSVEKGSFAGGWYVKGVDTGRHEGKGVVTARHRGIKITASGLYRVCKPSNALGGIRVLIGFAKP